MLYATNSLQVVPVTPDEAAEILRLNFAHNRKLRTHHVEFLLREMKAGRFLETAEIHIMFRNGEPVLVNGQHTLSAIVKFGKAVRVTMRKTITREVGQVAMYYAFGHDTGLSRTFRDALGSYDISNDVGLTDRQMNSLATAIAYIKRGFHPRQGKWGIKISAADVLDDIRIWAPQVKILMAATGHRDKTMSSLVLKAGVLSVAIATLFYQPDRAFEFWRSVVYPTGITDDDGRLLARRYILDSRRVRGATGYVSPGKLSRQLADCWNTFFKGERRSISRAQDNSPEIILLAGTLWNGKQSATFFPARATEMLIQGTGRTDRAYSQS